MGPMWAISCPHLVIPERLHRTTVVVELLIGSLFFASLSEIFSVHHSSPKKPFDGFSLKH